MDKNIMKETMLSLEGAALQSARGHRVTIISPQYVKPFVRRQKNDGNELKRSSPRQGDPTSRAFPRRRSSTRTFGPCTALGSGWGKSSHRGGQPDPRPAPRPRLCGRQVDHPGASDDSGTAVGYDQWADGNGAGNDCRAVRPDVRSGPPGLGARQEDRCGVQGRSGLSADRPDQGRRAEDGHRDGRCCRSPGAAPQRAVWSRPSVRRSGYGEAQPCAAHA